MTEVFVRQAEEGGLEVIAGFNKAMAMETEGKELPEPEAAEGTKGLLNNPDYGFYVVAEDEGEVVGSLMVTFEWSEWWNSVFLVGAECLCEAGIQTGGSF